MIYNNTIYVGSGITDYFSIVQLSVNTFICNNIFNIAGQSVYSNGSSSTVFNNNLWYGHLPAGVAFGAADVFANPTNAASSFKVISVRPAGKNLALAWLGGTNGYPGNWSMSVSSNLISWTLLQSKTISRDPSGTNTWMHTNGLSAGKNLFYRPCVEYAP